MYISVEMEMDDHCCPSEGLTAHDSQNEAEVSCLVFFRVLAPRLLVIICLVSANY